MVAQVIIAIPRHNNYHHPRAVAEGTSHCRTPACEGRPPVLGMVARCKALTKLSLTAPLLATPRGHTPLPRDCPQRGTHTSLASSLTPPCEVLGFSSPPFRLENVNFVFVFLSVLFSPSTPRRGVSLRGLHEGVPGRTPSSGTFFSSTRRSKSRPVCLTNVGRPRPSIGTR